MPPPTPRRIFISRESAFDAEAQRRGENAIRDLCVSASLRQELQYGLDRNLRLRGFAGQAVLHQPAPDFLHRDDGRFLRRRGQDRARASLKLPRALCRDNDEPVSALLRIVRQSAVGVVAWGSISHYFDTSSVPAGRACPAPTGVINVSKIGRISSSMRVRRTRSARTMEASVSCDSSRSRLTRT